MSWLIVLTALLSSANNPRNPDLQTIRCRGSLVAVGDPSFELIDKCGEPAYREVVEVVADQTTLGAANAGLGVAVGQTRQRVVQKWYYRFGRGRFTRMVEVSGGQVRRIEILRRQ